MNKQILIINGTPRENGKTDTILNKIIDGAESVNQSIKYYKLRELNIA